MHTALAESILAANSDGGLPGLVPLPLSSPSEVPVKIAKKRMSLAERPSTNNGDGPSENSTAMAPAKRGRPRIKNLDRPVGGRAVVKDDSEVDQSPTTLKSNSFQFNWEKNVIIPTRIIEHRHSVSDRGRGGGVAHLKREETRRNSIEIMSKSDGGQNVKENNRPVISGPLGMIGNIMESRAMTAPKNTSDPFLKIMGDFKTLQRELAVEAEESEEVEPEHHILLNGRSFEEIMALNLNATATAASALSEESES